MTIQTCCSCVSIELNPGNRLYKVDTFSSDELKDLSTFFDADNLNGTSLSNSKSDKHLPFQILID